MNALHQIPVLFTALLAVASFALADAGTGPDAGANPSATDGPSLTVKRDVAYCGTTDPMQALDVYFPWKPSSAPAPVVIYLHGGGWMMGDKGVGPGTLMIYDLAKRGYLVAAVNYRLATHRTWPAQIEDARCAVAYLKAHAKELGLDPARIGLMGMSAGGHLAALLGLEGLAQAVVAMYAPTDLAAAEMGGGKSQFLNKVFGATGPDSPALSNASPITHVKKDAPPFLLIHGEGDTVVPFAQSKRFHDALTKAGARSKLLPVKNAGHNLLPAGGFVSPTYQVIADEIYAFFDANLKK